MSLIKRSHQPIVMLIFILMDISTVAQPRLFQGIVKDNHSKQPLANVNIKLIGTNEGVFSGMDGRFSISLQTIPVSITLSCVGYEPLFYKIDKIPGKPVDLFLKQTTQMLEEVNINANRYKYVFKDIHYSILDYEIMEDQLLLLVFRYQLKRSELILLAMSGDTIAICQVPEPKPKSLFQDFLGNVHYISTKGNAHQCYYDTILKEIRFPYKTTHDSLLRFVKPFLFKSGDRYYFQEFNPDGLGKNVGYLDQKHQKKYIHTIQDNRTRKAFSDDVRFYNMWNAAVQKNQQSVIPPATQESGNDPPSMNPNAGYIPVVTETDLHANQMFNHHKINAPLVKIGENNLAVFKFSEGVIEFMDDNGRVFRTVPISFHVEANENFIFGILKAFIPISDWRWTGKIMPDAYYGDVYTSFEKNGMVQIRKIDLETGQLVHPITIPFVFPRKISIFQGNAYFLKKDISMEHEKWSLVNLRL